MTRVAAMLPGYASVARASELLHLAPRSVRDLIYRGRLPSLRVGRLHYVKAADVELERRRRLHLPLPTQRPRRAVNRTRLPRPTIPAAPPIPFAGHLAERRARISARAAERAAERAADVQRWSQRHGLPSAAASLPFQHVPSLDEPSRCASCRASLQPADRAVACGQDRLCLPCGRRALLDWADQRRTEAAAARQLALSLGTRSPDRPIDSPPLAA